jgi:hypothetical protein
MVVNQQPDRELVNAMGACLQLILEDIRSQYRHVCYETGRLEKAGVAVGHIFRELGVNVNQENGKYVPADPNQRVQRT